MKRIDQRDDLRASTDLLAFIPRLTDEQKTSAARNVRAKADAEGWAPAEVLAMLGLPCGHCGQSEPPCWVCEGSPTPEGCEAVRTPAEASGEGNER